MSSPPTPMEITTQQQVPLSIQQPISQQPIKPQQQSQQQPTPLLIQQPSTQAAVQQPAQTAPVVCQSPNVVTIPLPIVPPPEDIYTYVAVKGSLHAQDCSIFGLNKEEVIALSKRFTNLSTEIVNGILIKSAALDIINALSKLGYKVVCSSGEAEIVWTMQREL